VGIASSTPPTIGISLRKPRYTLELIRAIREFTVNIPTPSIFKEVDYCGLVTGRKRNKFEEVGFTPLPSARVKPPIIKECPYNIECRVSHDIMIGDFALILGEIVETHVDEDKADESKRAGLDMAKVNPLVYLAEAREYWELGKFLGPSFNVGKEIRERLKQDKS
jgi:flavin reductase (DIM6/NTAB) family NADH-FMN oxidoreductase RutF